MAKSRPDNRNKRRKKAKGTGTSDMSPDMAIPMLESSKTLLQTGQPEDALPLARKALACLSRSSVPAEAKLPALELLGEIYIELGDPDEARKTCEAAVEIDADGSFDGSIGSSADKFLWLAQLCENGGEESIKWFERGAEVLRREIDRSTRGGSEEEAMKRQKLASALCGAAEVYMTDLS